MDAARILAHRFEDRIVTYDDRDVMLYALGVGLGRDPADAAELKYLLEDRLRVLPGFAMVLGYPGPWLERPELQVDTLRMLHAEQSLTLERPLPVSGKIRMTFRVLGIADKGADKGCVLYYDKTLTDLRDGQTLGRIVTGIFCRGDGGTGDHGTVPPAPAALPDGPPDAAIAATTDPRAALIYRLTGDRNPIHADPAIAARAGYPRPILHGLATMGQAAHLLTEHLAGGDPARFAGISCRFNRPVFPGEGLRTEIWQTDDGARFRVMAQDRAEVVLDRGAIRIRS